MTKKNGRNDEGRQVKKDAAANPSKKKRKA